LQNLTHRTWFCPPPSSRRKRPSAKQLAEQWEREIQLNKRLQTTGQTARLEALETECAAWGAKDKAWGQTERLSPIEQTLTVQPISPATALALPRDWRVCSPSRAQAMTNRR